MTLERPDPTLARLRRGAGTLATAAVQRMDERLPWYRALPPEDRSWVGLVAQKGIAAFVAWYREPGRSLGLTADVFGIAPRELMRSISLQQTLDMLRTVVDAVEDEAMLLAAPGGEQALRESLLRFSREVAFAAAEVYARAAEMRGAWDARLEALVVDALVRGEADDALRSRAAALGWVDADQVTVMVGSTPPGLVENIVDVVRRGAATLSADALIGVQGDRLVVVLGHTGPSTRVAQRLAELFGPGPVVTGPSVSGLTEAGRSARAALAGFVAARAWSDAPRPVAADDLLPERLLSGDATARRALVDRAYRRLLSADVPLLQTTSSYLGQGRSIEAAARALFVHPNTVRYRLRRVADVTGWDPVDPREGFVLQVAIAAGRLADPPSRSS
ncbi:MAG TPA: helix-turn-helix domain-containing protein [Kineosporiaceae bacterium]|nr:helix-turn-helix domain-containing protein [Kineosporiaceae bacterium]